MVYMGLVASYRSRYAYPNYQILFTLGAVTHRIMLYMHMKNVGSKQPKAETIRGQSNSG